MVTETAPAKAGFNSFGLGQNIIKGIEAAGYTEPRPIQLETIPAVLDGRDVLGLAQTGTGKTAAFTLPILENLLAHKRRGPTVLILAPTRELAMQIHTDIEMLGKFTRVRSTTVYGGVSIIHQIRVMRSSPDIVVACPGRLLDLYGQGYINFDNIDTVVLDEADNMFDMGFLPDVRRILDAIPGERQTMLFSATMPKEIRHLADGILKKPVVVELGNSLPVSTIAHELCPVQEAQKFELLEKLIALQDFKSGIIFMRTKRRALRLSQQLARANYDAAALQGNMSQGQRDRAMKGFRDGKFNILVATDIAARGLDIAQVSHVINFDMPGTPDAYTHRIGRTGRAERSGKAFTFVTSEDFQAVHELERKLGYRVPRFQIEGIEGTEIPEAPAPGRSRSSHPAQSGGASSRQQPSPRRTAAPSSGRSERPAYSERREPAARSDESPPRPPRRSFSPAGRDERPGSDRRPPRRDGSAGFGESRPRRSYAPASRDERPGSDRRPPRRDYSSPSGPTRRDDGAGFGESRPRRSYAPANRDERPGSDRRPPRRDYSSPSGPARREDGTGYAESRPRRSYAPVTRDERPGSDRRPPRRDYSSPSGPAGHDERPGSDRAPRRSYAPANNGSHEERAGGESRPYRKPTSGAPARKSRFNGPPRSKSGGASRPRRTSR